MNSIQEWIEKYHGEYEGGLVKNLNSPVGKYSYQQKSGSIEIEGTTISINFNEVGGAIPVAEPIRMTLHLKKTYETELTLFPKGLGHKFLDFVLPKRKISIPESIRKQFRFDGDKNLLKKLTSDSTFTESILDENIYIDTGKEPIDRIVLTPAHGIKDVEQFEKFVFILKRIENALKTIHQNPVA
ncbi:hypothetical protein [Spongiimicrobium salis]|uniref:hypothetical protein n=1 Tax=Spongiimicrobium salis TaxID=1667022 RepID=UPI00374C8EDE